MTFLRKTLTAAIAASTTATGIVACGGSNDPTPIPVAQLIGRFDQGVSEGFSEIVALHAASNSVFITIDTATQPTSFQRVLLTGLSTALAANDPTADNLTGGTITNIAADVNTMGFTAGGVQALAVTGNLLAIAVQATPKTDNGAIAFYRLNAQGQATFLSKVEVGSLPDGVAFSPDGRLLVVANEGELSKTFATDGIDPIGSISVIAITNNTPAATATTLDFSAFNSGGTRSNELPTGVRISRSGASVAQDIEPEYVTISADSQTAYVTLQENNAVAEVSLSGTPRISKIMALGRKDHGLAANALAPSDKVTPPFALSSFNNLFGLYMPDGIANYSVGGRSYFVTANEGDDRNDFLAAEETSRVKDLTLDATAFPNAAALQADAALGRLNVFNNMGDTDNDGDFEELYALGARSFSIYDAATGTQVFDSAAEIERIVYEKLPSSLLSNGQVLGRLDNKGPEPESVVVGQIGTRSIAFVGLERSSAIMMYDISNPSRPQFLQFLQNTTDLKNGDTSPEGMQFVPASDSPTGKPMLLVGHEVSGSLAVYELK